MHHPDDTKNTYKLLDLPTEVKYHVFSFLDFVEVVLQKGLCLNRSFNRYLLHGIEPPKKLIFGALPAIQFKPTKSSDGLDDEGDAFSNHNLKITRKENQMMKKLEPIYDRITKVLIPKYLIPYTFHRSITFLDLHRIASKLTMKQTVDLCKELPNLTQVHFVNHFPTLAKLKTYILETIYPMHCRHLRVIDITSGELHVTQQQRTTGGTKQQVTPIQRLRSEEDFPVIVDYALLVLPNVSSTSPSSGAGGGGAGGSRYLKMNDEQTLAFLKQLIEKYHVPINTCIEGKYTFLSGACHNHHFECIKYLMEFGANRRKGHSRSNNSISRSISMDLINYAESSEREVLALNNQPNRALYFSFKRNFCIAPLVIGLKDNIINYLLGKGVSLCEFQIASLIQHFRKSLANLTPSSTSEQKMKILDKKKKQEQLLHSSLKTLNELLFTFDDLDKETGSYPIHRILDYSILRLVLDKMGLLDLNSTSIPQQVIDIVNTPNTTTGASVIHMLCASSSSCSSSIHQITRVLSTAPTNTLGNPSALDQEIFTNIQNLHNHLQARIDMYDYNGMMPIHLCVEMERYELTKEWLKWKPKHALLLTQHTNESILHIVVDQYLQILFDLSASSSDDEAGYKKCMSSNVILESPASPHEFSTMVDLAEENLLERQRIEQAERERESKLSKMLALISFVFNELGQDISPDELDELANVENDLGASIFDMVRETLDEREDFIAVEQSWIQKLSALIHRK